MPLLRRLLAALPLLLLSPFLIAGPALFLLASDLFYALFHRKRRIPSRPFSRPTSASVVIPNWNGRDLLEKYLPSVIAALEDNPQNEIIVVDNGSTDGSAHFVRATFPQVRVVALPTNEGFGGGSNAGFRAAQNDIVVLLNSDMRVDRGFLAPLLEGFDDDQVFAVSCQIFFSDPAKLREETGLTQASWSGGRLRVRHRIDDAITGPYPCFYGGGGSCAFDRNKFLELGGFDSLLAPFYLEDTDLGYLAWKRGWKVLYQPMSIVYHEHRGTIGKKFSPEYIQGVLNKNFLLFTWKNIHSWRWLLPHFFFTYADGILSLLFGDSPDRANLQGLWRANLQLPAALRSRWTARALSSVDDQEAFRRPLGGYFRDRFSQLNPAPDRLSVLFVSPYPICPPVHGGAVFMSQTVTELTKHCDLHLIALLDYATEGAAHAALAEQCASAEFVIRMKGAPHHLGSITPHAVTEFRNADLEWLIHRQIYLHHVDVVQLEYMPMGQYGASFRQIACILFEHDVYFQSIARQLPGMRNVIRRIKATFEYMRALRYELRLLPNMDRIQVCSADNAGYLTSFLPSLRNRIDADLRAGIRATDYSYSTGGREPQTMLFLGSFRHLPNQEALEWFVREVLPRIVQARPSAKLIVIGSDPPPRHSIPNSANVELFGFVPDIAEAMSRYAVFVCPILSGSGVRVKLLEAFASGIPVVSTRLGAEGLASRDGQICRLADDPQLFAESVLNLFDHPDDAAAMACRARAEIVQNRDMPALTRKLELSYRNELRRKRQS